jgi:carboxyl-terminal processing protease
MTITIARYKTPSGRIIQRPYEMGEGEKYRNDTLRYMHPDSTPHDSKLLFRTLHSNRKVYGGGGITPDIYIAPDTIALSQTIVEAHFSAKFEHAFIDYMDRTNIDLLKMQYPTIEDFDCGYALDTELLDIFNHHIGQVELTDTDKAFVNCMLRSLIAEYLYGSNARNYIYSIDYDYMLKQALSIARDDEIMRTTLMAE